MPERNGMKRRPEGAGRSGDRMTKTILLADDSLTIQKVVELTFADTAYNVVAVSSGDELLEKVQEVKPDLIICDIIMPGLDGYDVCQDIKSSPETLHIPVILLSGTFEPLDRDRALAAGCSEILTKPFEARKLIDTVERLVLDREERRAARLEEAGRQDHDTGPVTSDGAIAGDFGTRLTPDDGPMAEPADASGAAGAADDLEPSEALEFTASGFAEMEAAAAAERPLEAPGDGLEFEIGDGDIDPFADLDAAEPGRADEADAFADAFEADDEPFAGLGEDTDVAIPSGTDFSPGEPFAADPAADAGVSSGEIGDNVGQDELSAAVGAASESGLQAGEPEFELQTAEEAFGGGASFLTDADTAPLPPLETTRGETPEEPAPEQTDDGGRLSDEDVDRIARRVLELASQRIEEVAWEVIPDVAEIAVRERIRQLEAELETEN